MSHPETPHAGSVSRDTDRLVQVLTRQAVDTVIDIGANEGQFGRRLRGGGYRGRILSVEPIPSVRERLESAVSDDPDWTVAPAMALGAEPGRQSLAVAEASDMSSLAPLTWSARTMLADARAVSTVEVAVTDRKSVV